MRVADVTSMVCIGSMNPGKRVAEGAGFWARGMALGRSSYRIWRALSAGNQQRFGPIRAEVFRALQSTEAEGKSVGPEGEKEPRMGGLRRMIWTQWVKESRSGSSRALWAASCIRLHQKRIGMLGFDVEVREICIRKVINVAGFRRISGQLSG